ncbi:cbb3-type cytochrome c oxidase subunit 3 [Acuticoccus kalidii]|uniref:cbb3-type cytochrome c oxidase subunit 3 n=1 Tax=Acuticoccus kalidii TaxID=2910977 RepID=UPI0034E1FE91
MDYHSLRAFADTWGLLLLAGLFIGMFIFVFRRGSSAQYRRAARIALDAPEHAPASVKAKPEQTSGTTPSRHETKDDQ